MKKLIFIALLFSVVVAFRQDVLKTCKISKSCSLNEKPLPGTGIAKIKKSEMVDVIDIDGSYYKVNYKGTTGYVLDLFIYDPELFNIVKERKSRENAELQRKEKELRDSYKKYLVDKYGLSKAEDILKGKLFLGMTSDEVQRSWGYPDDINKTTYEFGVHEQWVYEGEDYKNKYLYFEDGILKTIQD
jgi:hypothetical protein